MKRVLLIFIVFSLFTVGTLAQNTNPKDEKTTHTTQAESDKTRPKNSDVSEAKSVNTDRPVAAYGEGKHWSFYVVMAGLFDSNINQDEDDINDYGAVAGAGVYFRNRAERPNFEFTYEIGRHEYARTSRWERTSHRFAVRSENRLGKKWISETSGEMSFKGSTEDRELTDRYSLTQFFQYRLTRNHRFNFGGAYRIKRYIRLDRLRDSTNPYLEGGYETRFGNGRRKLEFSYRYEENNARSDRNSYIRWTYGTQFETPLFKKGRLVTELRYRPQQYARLIEIELPNARDIDVPRRDKRWIFAADWRRPLTQALELGLVYKYEQRDSNDDDRDFKAHAAGVVLTYRWWK